MSNAHHLLRWATLGLGAVSCAAFVSFSAPAGVSPAQTRAAEPRKDAKRDKEKPWQPVVVPAPVLHFGAQLEDAASPALKDWLRAHVNQNLREKPIDPKVTIVAVDERFAAASDRARDTGIYLAYYFAHRDDIENERILSFRLREIDREADETSRQLTLMWKEEQRRLASPRGGAPSGPEVAARQEDERKLNERLRDLRDEREIKAAQIHFTRKKVDIYLKLLAAAYEKMKGTDPAILHELK